MNNINKKQYPIKVMYEACKMHSTGIYKVKHTCSKFKISKATLMRWMNKREQIKEEFQRQELIKLVPPGQITIEEELLELGEVS